MRQGVYSRDEVTHIGNRNEQIVIFRGAVWRVSKSDNKGSVSTVKRDQVTRVGGLSGCENLVCKREQLAINPFVNSEPVLRFKNR